MLSLDLYVSVLERVPAHRTDSDGVLTLVNCLQTGNSELREAALVGTLWKSHYLVRYMHSEEDSESRLRARFNSNWRLMYVERQRQDNNALRLLEQIVLHREGRYHRAATLASISFDIWDALEIQCLPDNARATAAPYALTRRFWAEAILETISRRFAILQWGRLINETENSVSFVEAFSSLSCFFGRSPLEMQSHLSALGNACQEYLIKRNKMDSDLPDMCTSICEFMHEQGFGAVEPSHFYDISNHFPHLYLTNKRSIPISLVHVFVSIARHLGISASPVEFPARVLAHVPSPAGSDDFLVDVYASDTKAIVSLRNDVPRMLGRLGISPDHLSQYVSPCGASPMLLRAARNILASFRNAASRSTAQSAIYAAVCIHLLLTNATHMLSHLDLDPLYCTTFLADMQPLLRYEAQHQLANACRIAMELEEQEAALVHSRTAQTQIAHYVGMVFEHKTYQYIGCITGWDTSCSATAEWQMNMNVHKLPRGADQPFYHVLSLDGGQRYVAEGNVNPRTLTTELASQFFKDVPVIARYFSDAQCFPDSRRGKFYPSPEIQRAYPDDDNFSKMYDE
ncbi:YccV-like-domain-containing protein [Mycena sanguinolenta]|nr:YccV-like-domain-containing protein [Mycena sanguinolenta]